MVNEPHKCDWEPRKCQYCSMQIIARDIVKHESSCQKNTSSSKAATATVKKGEKKQPDVKDNNNNDKLKSTTGSSSSSNTTISKPTNMDVTSASALTSTTRRSFEKTPPRSWSKYIYIYIHICLFSL